MLDLKTGLSLSFSLLYFVPPVLLLIIVPIICATIYTAVFKNVLPKSIFHYLFAAPILSGVYIWAVPMKTGFYEFFRSIF